MKRIAGYSLTGSTKEEKLFFFYGPGGNGKSKFVNALAACAGDYAVNAAMEAFVERRGERHGTDIAALVGARLVTASETEKGRYWDEALIGRLVGGDPVTARFMRRDNFTYQPQFTLLILGNHQPELSSVNEANRRRVVIIPFLYQPTKPDEDLADKLRAEYPAILHWMIEGAHDWYEYGLGEMPEAVRAETEDYFEDQNYVKAWIDECCLAGPNYTETSLNLSASWERWSKRNGVSAGSQKTLIQALKEATPMQEGPLFHTPRTQGHRGAGGIAAGSAYG